MKEIKIAIIGFGGAAKAFTKLLISHKSALVELGYLPLVTLVATRSRGTLYCPTGLDLEALLAYESEKGRLSGFQNADNEQPLLELLSKADYDVLVELSTLDIFSGQPAISHIDAAFKRWRHVITANKGPIAWDYQRLSREAQARSCQFLFETTVMDGTPIFNLVSDTLPFCQVKEIKGILNTTTNFILDHLRAGEDMASILAEGRRRGFVEADPSLDIDGWDAAAKLCALMNVLMGANMTPMDVHREGISGIDAEELQAAVANGQTIKLLCHGYSHEGKFIATVKPTLMPLSSLYANVDETSSVVSLETDLMGTLTVVEHNPEIEQTGFGIFSDFVRLLKAL